MEYYLNLTAITSDSIVNGDGLRTVFWMQGCPHGCVGCHREESWEFRVCPPQDYRRELIDLKSNSLSSGITITGGEPLAYRNTGIDKLRPNLLYTQRLIEKFLEYTPDKDIWLYTGFRWEVLLKLIKVSSDWVGPALEYVLSNVKVLVDGRYNRNKPRGYMRGSQNQLIIKCSESFKAGKLISFENDYYKNFEDQEVS